MNNLLETLQTALPIHLHIVPSSEHRSITVISHIESMMAGGKTVRRKQTAAFLAIIMLSSVLFLSQTRPQSPVGSTDPDDATGGADCGRHR